MKVYWILIVLGVLCALFSSKIDKLVNMNATLKLLLDGVLVILAIIVAVGNFSKGIIVSYFSSIICIAGAVTFLAVDLRRMNNSKRGKWHDEQVTEKYYYNFNFSRCHMSYLYENWMVNICKRNSRYVFNYGNCYCSKHIVYIYME